MLRVKLADTYIFSSEDGEVKKALLSEGEEVAMLQKGPNRSKIKASGGTVGWVSNSNTEYIIEDKGVTFELDPQKIQGWLDNPTAIYILDEKSGIDGMLLTRTWENEIFEFIDREEIERGNLEN